MFYFLLGVILVVKSHHFLGSFPGGKILYLGRVLQVNQLFPSGFSNLASQTRNPLTHVFPLPLLVYDIQVSQLLWSLFFPPLYQAFHVLSMLYCELTLIIDLMDKKQPKKSTFEFQGNASAFFPNNLGVLVLVGRGGSLLQAQKCQRGLCGQNLWRHLTRYPIAPIKIPGFPNQSPGFGMVDQLWLETLFYKVKPLNHYYVFTLVLRFLCFSTEGEEVSFILQRNPLAFPLGFQSLTNFPQ